MTKSKTTISFETRQKTCFAWCVDMHNLQPISVRTVKRELRNTSVKSASSGTMTVIRAYTTAMIVASVG